MKATVHLLIGLSPDPPNDLAWSFPGGFVIFVLARAVSEREVFAGLSGFSTRVVSGCAVWAVDKGSGGAWWRPVDRGVEVLQRRLPGPALG
jgi:hypothetical protein